MKQSYLHAVNISALAAKQNVLLAPQPNSPLELMYKSVTGITPDFGHIATIPEDQQNAAVTQFLEFPIEDIFSDIQAGDMVRNIGNAVSGQIDFIQNEVVPNLNELVEATRALVEVPDNFNSQFDVEVVDLPAVMREEAFRAMIEDESGGLLANPESNLVIPHTGPASIADYLMTGSNTYDEKIRLWLQALGDKFVVKAWEEIFSKSGTPLVELMADIRDGVNYALMTYLAGRRLTDEIPEGIVLTLSQYRNILSQYKDAAAKQLASYYKRQDTLTKAGMLVLSADSEAYKVKVNGEVYRKYLEQGGKNEVVFGSVLSNATVKGVDDLIANADEFYQTYQRYEAINASRRRLNAYNTFRSSLKIAFVNQAAKDTSTREQEARANFGLDIGKMSKTADEVIDNLTKEDINNPYVACMKVLCRARFAYTDAEEFLTNMTEASAANPALDPREAALPALVELITAYVAAQIINRSTG